MLLFAAAYRARLILVNRRDYPGSTPFTDTELALLGSQNLQTHGKALVQQGLDIGLFLAWLVRKEKIPPVSIDPDGNKRGGIALVPWSLAHTPLAGFLAHADTLPADARKALEPCLRAYCIFGRCFPSTPSQLPRMAQFNSTRPPDAPHILFGLLTLSKYHPLLDPTYSMEERVPCFHSWVSTYYTHSNFARRTRKPALLDTTPIPYPVPPCARPATLDVIDPVLLESVSWHGPIQGSEALLHGMLLSLAFEQTRRILFDKGAGRVLPRCKVVVVWGENTLWEMVGAAWSMERLYKERKAVGKVGRSLEVMEMPGANHFVSPFKFLPLVGLVKRR